ncbi:MAG: glycosyltransferase [Pedobacter sp.]|nr:MAG: glycosyltransferase [Pedobacter sp.]
MLLGRTLFINAKHPNATGAAVISDRNFKLISESTTKIFRLSIDITLSDFKANIFEVFFLRNLVKTYDINSILKFIKDENIQCVFLDNSLFGNLAKEIKRNVPEVYILSFFHNVEYSYFKELIKVSKKIHHWYTLLLVKKAERQTIKYSNWLLALNNRDSADIKMNYGKNVDIILPTTFSDQYDGVKSERVEAKSDILKLLFVGSYFPPNIFGIDWFIKNIMPSIKRQVQLYVVGSGFESHQIKNIQDNIKMVGAVHDLGEYYYLSDLIIAPIFHGSGMKTKVAEALMYNRPIFGTREAFEGYEIDITTIGSLCRDKFDFIKNIEEFEPSLYTGMRDAYLNNYSYETIRDKFIFFLNAEFE